MVFVQPIMDTASNHEHVVTIANMYYLTILNYSPILLKDTLSCGVWSLHREPVRLTTRIFFATNVFLRVYANHIFLGYCTHLCTVHHLHLNVLNNNLT